MKGPRQRGATLAPAGSRLVGARARPRDVPGGRLRRHAVGVGQADELDAHRSKPSLRSRAAAPLPARSMSRSSTNGPRSLTRTTSSRRFWRLTTRTRLGSGGCAADHVPVEHLAVGGRAGRGTARHTTRRRRRGRSSGRTRIVPASLDLVRLAELVDARRGRRAAGGQKRPGAALMRHRPEASDQLRQKPCWRRSCPS